MESETGSMVGLENEAEASFTESGDDETVFWGEEGGSACGGVGGMEESGFISLCFVLTLGCQEILNYLNDRIKRVFPGCKNDPTVFPIPYCMGRFLWGVDSHGTCCPCTDSSITDH